MKLEDVFPGPRRRSRTRLSPHTYPILGYRSMSPISGPSSAVHFPKCNSQYMKPPSRRWESGWTPTLPITTPTCPDLHGNTSWKSCCARGFSLFTGTLPLRSLPSEGRVTTDND